MSSFNILSDSNSEIAGTDKSLPLNDQIKNLLNQNSVILFMKGNSDFPQCGFSANSVAILKKCEVPFKTFNILSDADIRQGLKEFSNWPTYPQLYVKG
jgi:monothiol glutaredoxin